MHDDPAAKLANFRERHKISMAQAGKALGASGPTVLDWERGLKVPTMPYRDAIEIWTSGEIKASEWQSTRERAAAARTAEANVQPFEPPTVATEEPTDEDTQPRAKAGAPRHGQAS